MQRRAVFERNDATAKDDDIVQPCLNQLLAHLGEQVSVSTRKGGEAEETGVFISDGVNDLLGCASKTGVNHLMPGISQGACNDFRPSVVAVQPGFRNDDAQGVLHDGR